MGDASHMQRLAKAVSNPRVIWLALCALMISLWWLTPLSSFHSEQSMSSIRPKRAPQLDIVVAHYRELPEEVRSSLEIIKQLPTISMLHPRVIVYTKGSTVLTDREALKEELGADILHELPNVGREADTHLTHIIKYYDELADHTLFLQAGIEFRDFVEAMLRTHFRPTLGAMCLGTHATCPCNHCVPRIYGNPDPIYGYKRIPQLYSIFNERFVPPNELLLCFKSQFIISRNRITRIPIRKFEWLKGVFNDVSHFVHDDVTEEQSIAGTLDETPENPLFGHTLERAWMVIFGCSDGKIHEVCDPHDFTSRCACYDDDNDYV